MSDQTNEEDKVVVKKEFNNGFMLFLTLCYNYYLYYVRYLTKKLLKKFDLYKIVIGASIITVAIAFFVSLYIFLQASFSEFGRTTTIREDVHRRLHEERLKIKLAPGNFSKWQPLEKGVLYNAYFDPRQDVVHIISQGQHRGKKPDYPVVGIIRVLGILPRLYQGVALFCHIKYPDGKLRVVPTTEVQVLDWNKSYYYLSFMIMCDIEYYKHATHILPQYIGLSESVEADLIAGVYLPIIYPRRILQYQHPEFFDKKFNLAICIGPENSFYETTVLHLNEFFDYYRKLGANQIFVYGNEYLEDNSFAGLLRKYTREGFITIVPWNLKGYEKNEIYMSGNVIAWNDCIYRAGLYYGYKYLTVLDFTEFIKVKKGKEALVDLINYVNKEYEEHPIYAFVIEDYYIKHNDIARFMDTELYCLANEVHPLPYTPIRYLFMSMATMSVSDREIEGVEVHVANPALDIPENVAMIRRFSICHIRMDHCQCNFEWPRKERERREHQKRYRNVVPPKPKNHSMYAFRKPNGTKKVVKRDDPFFHP